MFHAICPSTCLSLPLSVFHLHLYYVDFVSHVHCEFMMLRGNYRKFVSSFFFNLIRFNFVIFYVAYVEQAWRYINKNSKNVRKCSRN